jgi:hypothetical protein
MRYAARADGNQPEIVDALRKAGAYVWVIKLPVDILIGYAGKTALIEIKTATGKRTKLQEDFLREWTGGTVAVIRDVEGAINLLRTMSKNEHTN